MSKEKILEEQVKELEKLIALKDARIVELEKRPTYTQPYYPYQQWPNIWYSTTSVNPNTDTIVSGNINFK